MPAPRSAAPVQQGSVAVATRQADAFTPYVAPSYSRPGLPYAPLVNPSARRGDSGLVKLLVALGVLLAVGSVAAVMLGAHDRNANKNALSHTSIQFPAEVAGLNKITGPVADQLASVVPVGSGYQSVGYSLADGTPRAVVVIGKIAVGDNIDAGLAGEERGLHDTQAAKGIALTRFTDVDAGPLGGRMQCGSQVLSGVGETVCMFVDRAVVGSVLMVDRHDDDASQDLTLAHQLRAAVETRS